MSSFIETTWKESIVPTLCEYISVPNQSPQFDPQWEENGLLMRAMDIIVNWVSKFDVKGMKYRVLSEPKRTPLLFIEIDGCGTNETVLLYGHMDKQPPLDGQWHEGLGPFKPVIRDGKLYGRGGADDGYSCFCALTAISHLQRSGQKHARYVVLIEGCEESGSRDLPHYMEVLKNEIGTPSLVVCLDSGCANYEQLWLTSSLRGLFMATLKVKVLTEGTHSGSASGIVPSSFRILRLLLDRIEDPHTGEFKIQSLNKAIPEQDEKFAALVSETIKDEVYTKFPWAGNTQPVTHDCKQLLLNGSWRPTLCITGISGLPGLVEAGNVLRTETTVKLSIRCPPSANPAEVEAEMRRVLTTDVPYNAQVEFELQKAQQGWVAPVLDSWLSASLEKASQTHYNKPFMCMGEGGSIPFIQMLYNMYPSTQFVITGVLGPSSNAHGPNEFLHIDYATKLTKCVADILADHYVAKCQ